MAGIHLVAVNQTYLRSKLRCVTIFQNWSDHLKIVQFWMLIEWVEILPNSLLLQTRNMFGNQSTVEPNPFPSSEAPINFCKCDGWHIFLARIFMATFLPPSYFSTQNSAHPTSFNLSRSILRHNFYFSFSSRNTRLLERYSCCRLETRDWKKEILVSKVRKEAL